MASQAKYIARHLLDLQDEVITLTNTPNRGNPFGKAVKAFPYNFSQVVTGPNFSSRSWLSACRELSLIRLSAGTPQSFRTSSIAASVLAAGPQTRSGSLLDRF